jgi:hypothetical protein
MEVLHPRQYSELLEEKIINLNEWKISNIPQVMIFDNTMTISYEIFYSLFFPIFSETSLQDEISYKKHEIYLINYSRKREDILLTKSKCPKIIYFVNNSNARIKFKNTEIDLIDKKGKSIFVDSNSEIKLTRPTNIQSCIVILSLSSKDIVKENLLYN